MSKLRVIIADDEELGQKLVAKYLENAPVEICAVCSDGYETVKAVNELKPDLIFLDVQMPKLTGFEAAELFEHRPKIIFTTAYDQYAIKAFEINASDYLLKPFSAERLLQALDKARATSLQPPLPHQAETAPALTEPLERIAVKSGTKIHVIPVSEVQYFETDGNYVKIFTADKQYLKESPIKYYEQNLPPRLFLRTHRSHLINVSYLERIEQMGKDQHLLIMKNGAKLKISDNGYKLLREMLEL